MTSASLLAGIAAVYHTVICSALPASKVGFDYCVRGTIDGSMALEQLKKPGCAFKKGLYLAGLALAIEGFNKYFVRNKFYEKLEQAKN